MRVAFIAVLFVIGCGGKEPPANTPTTSASSGTAETGTPAAAESTEPLPPVTKIGDACRLSKDCSPLGSHHKCMKTGATAHCYASPTKVCDAPECDCFNNDPCAANDLGTCTGYERGVVICSK